MTDAVSSEINTGGAKPDIPGQLRSLQVPEGQLAVWALGQQGYILKGGHHILVIDPYLSNHIEDSTPEPPGEFARLVPIAVQPDKLDMVNYVLTTHHHGDHCDPFTLLPLLSAAGSAKLVGSYTCRDLIVEQGLAAERIIVPPLDEWVDYGDGLSIKAIPSAHYGFEPDKEGNPAFLGFIIRLNGVTLYHSGDSIIYEGLEERLRAQHLNLMCLPVNGRDWYREHQDLVGNMDYREASELTARMGADVLLPGHNDMFRGNRINPAYVLDYLATHHPQQRFHFLQAGELYLFAG